MANTLFSLFFPPRCPVCKGKREEAEALCPACKRDYERDKHRPCPVCHRAANACQCRPRYESSAVFCYLSVFRYRENSPGGRMILKLKDGKSKAITALLERDMAKSLQKGCILRHDALVTFVPRSKSARLERGTDQERELARALADHCTLECRPCLDRRSKEKAQKDLDAAGRMESAQNSYKIGKNCPDLAGRQVILVDDVLTTGATMNACAAILREAGAGTVVCLTAGRR
ncbi:MAG: ComF family protein [Clostridia bacterium]|nr:ComF family protein [Clostridia bacterium]